MTLRSRVLIGSVVIALVLAVAALIITWVTESHLIERVDQQLASGVATVEACGEEIIQERDLEADPPSSAVGGGDRDEDEDVDGEDELSPVGCKTPATEEAEPVEGRERDEGDAQKLVSDPFSFVSIMRVSVDGTQMLLEGGNVEAPDGAAPTPDVDIEEAMESWRTGEPFTIGTLGRSDMRWRARAISDEEAGELLVVVLALDDVDAIIGRLIVIEVVVTLAILATLGLVAWWVDRHGMRPVKQMTGTASAIAAGDLSHRVPESNPGTEAGQLGQALNQMLGRLEQAFGERARSEARLRQFVADASHELRTPVATIRGYSELYEAGGLDDDEELSEAMRRTREEALRMGALVDDMLLLARLDRGRELARQPVDVAALLRDAGRDAQAVDPGREVVVDSDESLQVLADDDRLRQVMGNLVGNALVHTPSSATLKLRSYQENGCAVIEVVDAGPGMSAEVRDHAFEHFYRADQSRSRHRGGSGLGLAIVKACVDAHDGTVTLDSAPGRGTTMRVCLPLISHAGGGGLSPALPDP